MVPVSRKPSTKAAVFSVLLALSLLLECATAMAQPQFEEEFDDKEKPWEEIAIQLPAAPKPENLLPFYVSATATQSFTIDAQAVSVGTDGVVRYILVATSNGGAKNVSYEGIRCESFERKLYAFGQPDGTWSRSKRDQWERINSLAANRQHAALAKDYFCQEKTVSGKADELVNRIRHNKTLTSH